MNKESLKYFKQELEKRSSISSRSNNAIAGVGSTLVGAGVLANIPKSLITGRKTYYHGSTKDVVKSIKEKGLLSSKASGRNPINTKVLNKDTNSKSLLRRAKSQVYVTSDINRADTYSFQSQKGGVAKTNKILKKDPFALYNNSKTYVAEAHIPVWQKEKFNPEVVVTKNKQIKAGFDAKTAKASAIAAHSPDKSFSSVSSKYIKGSKNYRPFYKDLGTYARRAPKKFATGAALGLAGVGAVTYGVSRIGKAIIGNKA